MASQRITRETFDAVVQEKMKRYRVNMDQAISDTIREFHLDGPSTTRMPVDNYESFYREKQRYSYRDLPPDTLSRNLDIDNVSDQSYFRELGRESSGGRLSDQFLNRWGADNPLVKERLYREELNASNRRLDELDQLRSLECNELFARELNVGRRNWETEHNALRGPERNMGRTEMFREFRSPQSAELGPRKDTFRSQTRGVMRSPAGKGPMGVRSQRGGGRQGKAGEASTKQQESKKKTGNLDSKSPSFKFSVQIQKWAKFNTMESDADLLKQHKALFKVKTETCKMIVDCFKGPMTSFHREQCFSRVKTINHSTMKSPKIDNDLLDLLIETKTVSLKNDFFEVIKPFDKEMMMAQQRLLRCVTPLLIACNTFELKHAILTDPRQLLGALKSTVFLCRKSIVLLGQTFEMISSARQSNVLEALGLCSLELKPSEYPNFKDSFLFGKEFVSKLRDWLQKSGNKLTLKSRDKLTEETGVDKKEECKTVVDSQERKAADLNVVAAIDQLLENAKKGNQVEGEKPAFWWLFDKDSNEFKYYRQKLEEFQNSVGQVGIKNTQTKRTKKSPEELACESVRAMLYAKKAQALKRRLFKCVVYSRKRKLIKVRRPHSKKAPAKVEKVTQELKQETPMELTTEKSACKVEVISEKTPDKCSTPATTESEKDKPLPSIKEELPAETKSLEVDEKTKDTAIKLAQFVVQMGPEIEEFSMENSVNNPEFWFLREKDSPAYIFYKGRLEEFKRAEEEAASDDDDDVGLDDGDLENIRVGDDQQNESDDVEMDAECEAAEAPGAAVAAFNQMPIPARPPVVRKRVAKLKVGMLPPKRVCLVEDPKVHDPVRIEYERPRGRRYNRRKKPADLEFASKKLDQQNVGFQMLSKMGWQEGQGLGSSGSGIKNPIKVGAVSAGEGLGVEGQTAGESANTNFDAFRQRMMQMYKKKITK
ncbi:SURP and G-patch domain-containing protein 2 [Mixophyes fleayi]|uniref:SURP and G-patch domain-containing protein 2 n=1 Tax=Mixophyes fleayi TaxID=3061075 RepID=UPI003F4DFE2B